MTIYQDYIGQEDIRFFDGKTRTFERSTSTGGLLTLDKVGNLVDVRRVYGSGTANAAALNSAIAGVGATACTFILSPETWTIDANVTVPSTVTLVVPQGAVLTVSAAKTLTVNGQIDAEAYQIFAGAGAITFAAGARLKSSWFADFGTAITKIVTVAVALEVTKAETINDVTVNANTTLIWTGGGAVLTVSAAKTLTVNGQIDAGLYQVFAGSGTVTINSGSVSRVYPQWWGAKGNGVNDDTAEIQAAIDSLSPYGTVFFLAGTYIVSDTITYGAGHELRGQGFGTTTIQATAGGIGKALIASENQAVTTNSVKIVGLKLDNLDRAKVGGIGLDLTNTSMTFVEDVHINNCEKGIKGLSTGAGVGYYNEFYRTHVYTCTNAVDMQAGAADWRWFGGRLAGHLVGFQVAAGGFASFSTLIESTYAGGTCVKAIGTVAAADSGATVTCINTRIETGDAVTCFDFEEGCGPCCVINPRFTGGAIAAYIVEDNVRAPDDPDYAGVTNQILSGAPFGGIGFNDIRIGDSDIHVGGGHVRVTSRNRALHIRDDEDKAPLYKRFDFLDAAGDIDASPISGSYFNKDLVGAGTANIVEAYSGLVDCVTAAANNDKTSIIYTPDTLDAFYDCKMEAYVRLTALTNVYMMIGFVGAAFADKAAKPNDYIGIEFDSAVHASNLYMISRNNGAGEVKLDSGKDITANTFIKVFIDCTVHGAPRFWVNDVDVTGAFTGTLPSSVLYHPYFHVQTLTTAAKTGTIDFIDIWQRRVL